MGRSRRQLPAQRFARLLLTLNCVLPLWAIALPAEGSHFRGAAMLPSVDASGVLTLTSTSFWRPTAVSGIDEGGNPFVTGVGVMVDVGSRTIDTSDSRFTRVEQQHQIQLPGSGTYAISASSCCRVAGIRNAFESTWTMNSTIVWDGVNPTTPIQFNFAAIQVEVGRDQDYVGSVGAIAAPGLTLTYDQALNQNIFSQPPGFTINPTSGAMFIAQADAATYLDNPTANVGADYAFSGNIFASDGSQVEFDWLFDAVDMGPEVILAPEVDNAVVVVEVGDLLEFTATGEDPNSPPLSLTWDLAAFLGSGANLAPTFDPLTQLFTWDTVGSLVGTYAAQFRANNGSKTDIGTLTIHLIDDFDPFGGIRRTPTRNVRMRLNRPSPTTSAVRCVETDDPSVPDFMGVPFTQFTNGSVEIDIELSEGSGTKTVCCEFLESTGAISEPICQEIELEPPLDHFKCYEAEGDELDLSVSLADQFGSGVAFLEEPELLCNPVDKNGEGIVDPTAHLTCYGLEGDDDSDESESDDEGSDGDDEGMEREVVIENQFGTQILIVDDADLLCAPSEKNGVPSELQLEHFQCYEARGDALDVRVDLEDQFEVALDVRVANPELFCNPVDKNGEGIRDSESHLTCYAIGDDAEDDAEDFEGEDSEDDESDEDREVLVDNQFGAQILEVEEAEFLCVPSDKLAVIMRRADGSVAQVSCGIGFELVLVLSPLLWLHQRRKRSGAAALDPR